MMLPRQNGLDGRTSEAKNASVASCGAFFGDTWVVGNSTGWHKWKCPCLPQAVCGSGKTTVPEVGNLPLPVRGGKFAVIPCVRENRTFWD